MVRIECPTCATSYTHERCGIVLPAPDQYVQATVVCVTCKTQFEVAITPAAQTTTPGWFARNIMRRTPETTFVGHKVMIQPR